jgi:GNAT superfamily N-acetyltransferase
MHIRRAVMSDAAALAQLIEAFNSDHLPIVVTPAQAAARLAATAGLETTFVADAGGTLAGFACLRLVPYMSGDEPYAELTDLFVAAPFRRQGVARGLG